jgi:NHL repeat
LSTNAFRCHDEYGLIAKPRHRMREEMKMQGKKVLFPLVALLALSSASPLPAESAAYTGSGGSFSASSTLGQPITLSNVPLAGTTSTLSMSCPITLYGAGTYQINWHCAGGTITISSTDGSLSMNGAIAAGSMTFSGSGGGRGGHVTYWYQFSGTFSSRVALSGVSKGALGSVSFYVKTTSQTGSGSVAGLNLGWNSQYSPVLVASGGNARLLLADNLTGVNLRTYGTWGSGTGQFETISGLARDAAGHIYIVDSTLDRLVRIDNISGANWLQLGSSGTGALHFSNPAGVAIDSAGKIWVADAGNNRIVRFDNMTGTNWTAFGAAGSAANQFSSPAAIAFDSQGRIYVADSGNGRLVRFDDLTGKNWNTLSTIPIGVYAYSLSGVNGVAVLPSGKIVASTPGGWLFRVDDLTGANPQAGNWQGAIAGISRDPGGAVYVTGSFPAALAQTLDADGTGFFGGSMGQTPLQASAVLAMASSIVPPPAPLISTGAISFGNRNVGEPGTASHVGLTNIGGTPLAISSISADTDFKITNPCPALLDGGRSCAVSVQFDPTSTGPRSTTLSISTNGVHPLLKVALNGTGTAPNAVLLPGSLVFNPQQTTTSNGAQSAILTNTGTGPLTIASITPSGDYSVSGNCPSVIAPGNGCTLQVKFTPTAAGTRTGAISISDDNVPGGTTQSITLTGTGRTAAPALSLTPESLLFPAQQVGVSSGAQTLTLHNGSAGSVSLSAPVLPAGFTGSTSCGATLGAGASCTIQVRFAPSAAGPLAAAVSIPVSGQPAMSAGVSGTGVASAAPVLVASPSPVAFGVYVVGDNPSMNMTVKNPKGYPVGIRSSALAGSSALTVTANNCPAILPGGASCTVQFTFIPTSVNSYSATWTLTETSGAKSAISITGSGGTDGGGN